MLKNKQKNKCVCILRWPRSATFFYKPQLFPTNRNYFLHSCNFFLQIASNYFLQTTTLFYKSQQFSTFLQLFSTNRNYFLHSCNFFLQYCNFFLQTATFLYNVQLFFTNHNFFLQNRNFFP